MNTEHIFSITLVVSIVAHIAAFAMQGDLFAMNNKRIIEIPVQLHEPPPPVPKPKLIKPKPQPPKRIVRPKVMPPVSPPVLVPKQEIERSDVVDKIVERPVFKTTPIENNSPTNDVSVSEIKNITRNYLKRLRAVVESAKRYPNLARRNDMEGAVRLRFVILPNGMIEDISIVSSSGVDMLDQAAIKALMAASGTIKPPDEIRGKKIRSSVKLRFELDK